MTSLISRAVCAISLTLYLLPGCGTDGSGTQLGGPPGFAVAQGGSQDIAQFRAEVDDGRVPSPVLLDPVGFFAEHALPQVAADCGEVVCVHPSLAVAPRFDGGNWTMAFVSLNTSVPPTSVPHVPVHLVAVVEKSFATTPFYDAIRGALAGVDALLSPGDMASLVVAGSAPLVAFQGAAQGSAGAAFQALDDYGSALDGVDLYSALETAYRIGEGTPGQRTRLLLVTSGRADVGITDPERFVALATGHAERGVALSVVGLGSDYRADLPRSLGGIGAGTYAYAEDDIDLKNALTRDLEVTLVPLATSFSLRIDAAAGYRVGRVYGATTAMVVGDAAVLESPALFVAGRSSVFDTELGRRGGGGGLFVELLADPASGLPAGSAAFTTTASYVDDLTGLPVTLSVDTQNALAPAETPTNNWPEFSDPAHPKAFMMLNMYLALRAVTLLADQGDCAHALGIIQMMGPTVESWQAQFQDPDIAADSLLLQKLGWNIEALCGATPAPDPTFAGSCFSS